MSRSGLLFLAGSLVCGLSASALAGEQGVAAVGALVSGLGGATIVDEMPYDYPPPYSAAHPYGYPRYHHYGYRYRHYAGSPYHPHSGIEPYSYYYPEK